MFSKRNQELKTILEGEHNGGKRQVFLWRKEEEKKEKKKNYWIETKRSYYSISVANISPRNVPAAEPYNGWFINKSRPYTKTASAVKIICQIQRRTIDRETADGALRFRYFKPTNTRRVPPDGREHILSRMCSPKSENIYSKHAVRRKFHRYARVLLYAADVLESWVVTRRKMSHQIRTENTNGRLITSARTGKGQYNTDHAL